MNLRPTIICCPVYDKKILLFFKKDYKMWMLPQGGIDSSESPAQAIFRELTEEVGADFVSKCSPEVIFLKEDEIDFKPRVLDVAKFVTESVENKNIKGKYYYVYLVNCLNPDFLFEKKEFDEYFWLEYKGAKGLVDKIYQVNKRKQLLEVLDILKAQNYIE
ncbi:NUDIX domain-containing protein [candidate division WWE3 bacterium]|nr:NUDIX domain-containing protein [candidate division WWE3 bacterium]